jgi:uncharacterized protein (DUF2132 family)
VTQQKSADPLHGVTLETILRQLVEQFGWAEMALALNLNCFKSNPDMQSSLKFLRRTPWARRKVEEFYLEYRSTCTGQH